MWIIINESSRKKNGHISTRKIQRNLLLTNNKKTLIYGKYRFRDLISRHWHGSDPHKDKTGYQSVTECKGVDRL